MSINVNTGGLWKEAIPFVRPAGSWKQADAYVRQGGLWYQTTSRGLDILIDSATPLYDFNLKNWLITAGLWSDTSPVIIKTLTITARTLIAHTQYTTRTQPEWGGKNGVPVQKVGFTLTKTISAGSVISNVSGGVTYYTEYMHDVWAYTQDLTAHAFTTGEGWPAGSRIETFLIEGKIQGRGGDGAGIHGYTQYDTRIWNTTAPTKQTNANNLASIVLFRHGYPAFRTTIPIGTLNVTGEVAGGGAGGAYPSPGYAPYTVGNAERQANAEQQIALWNAMEKAPQNGPEGSVDTGRVVSRPGYGSLYSLYVLGGHAAMAAHGCGGGYGGGLGGLRQVLSNSTTDTWVLGTDGGNGTLTSAGGAGTSTVTFNSTDSKFGGTPSKLVGGGIPGANKGQDADTKLTVYQTLWDGTVTARFDNGTPTVMTDTTLSPGSTYLPSKVFFAKGGESITGKSLITNISGNFFGRQV